MKTIKLLLITTLILVGINLSAQEKKITFGVKAGLNMSSVTGDNDGAEVRFGYNIGATVDFSINENWYILSGLEYTTKGVNGEKHLGFKPSIHAAYLQLPIHAAYKLEVAPQIKLVFHAGPYLAYGINGKFKTLIDFGSEEIEGKVNTFDYLKRFDAGLGLGAGAEFGKFGVDLGWDYGVLNVVKEGDGTLRNANAYLTVGYKF